MKYITEWIGWGKLYYAQIFKSNLKSIVKNTIVNHVFFIFEIFIIL
jgi:hypothetical protein